MKKKNFPRCDHIECRLKAAFHSVSCVALARVVCKLSFRCTPKETHFDNLPQ